MTVYPLPSEINPSDTVCVQLVLPNNWGYITAFLGQMLDLAKWTTWERDPGQQATLVATVMRQVYESIQLDSCPPPSNGGGCGCDCEGCMQFRQQDCLLQVFDCLTQQWVTIYDGSLCTPNTAPGGGATQPGPGKCADVTMKADAGAQTPLPWAVSTGDTLNFSNVSGAGNDGTAQWYCPDGSIFYLGACVGGGSPSSGDPLNTTNHMALLLKIGSNYYPLVGGIFTVPSGVSGAQAYIQVNDPTLGSCHGTYTLTVEYCNNATPPATTWRAHIPFKTNSGGFVAIPLSTNSCGQWTPGTGWTNTTGISSGVYYDGVYIRLSLAAAVDVTSVEVKGSKADGNNINPANTCFFFQDQTGNDLAPQKTFGSFPASPFDMAGTGHPSVSRFDLFLIDYEYYTPGTYGQLI